MGGYKGTVRVVVELAAIVGLKGENTVRKLCLDVGIEENEEAMNFGLATNGKSPHIMSKIIKNNKIVLITGYTQDGTHPQITMTKFKRKSCFGSRGNKREPSVFA